MAPLLPPKQETLVIVRLTLSAVGSLIVTEAVPVQPEPFVTVME